MSGVSHEMKNHVAMVRSYAEMIKDLSGDNPEQRNAHLDVIIEESDCLNLLLGDFFTLTRARSGLLPLLPESFYVRPVLAQIIGQYEFLYGGEYTFNVFCASDINVSADREKIRTVITALLNNAMIYCGDSKRILVSVMDTVSSVRFEFTGYGEILDRKTVSQMWDAYRESNAGFGSSKPGSGLGLVVAGELLSMHDAEFGVKSDPASGNVFWFEL